MKNYFKWKILLHNHGGCDMCYAEIEGAEVLTMLAKQE